MVDCYSCIACATLLPSIFPTTASNSSSSSSYSASAVTIKFSPKSTFSFLRNTSIGLTCYEEEVLESFTPLPPPIEVRSSNTTTNPPDYYKVVELRKNATLQEIKTSYRALARKHHPDMNKADGAEDKFKEISAAYEVLSDEEKRSVYDRFGEAGLQGNYDGSGTGFQEVDPCKQHYHCITFKQHYGRTETTTIMHKNTTGSDATKRRQLSQCREKKIDGCKTG